MKKVMNKINLAIVALMLSVPAFAATTINPESSGLCKLIAQLHNVFVLLRTLAFVGAAFYIAGWAWDFISKGKADPAEIKNKGIGLLVGFGLLFMIGLILTFVTTTFGAGQLGCGLPEW